MAVMTSNTLARLRRVAPAAVAVLALTPAAASAKIIELGKTASEPTPSCPAKPCLAVSRTTGYQAKVGTQRDLFTAPEDGRIVAWTISLGAPTKKQIAFFNSSLGGPPSAGITVLKPSPHLTNQVTSQSPVEPLTPYLGETVQFPLGQSLTIKKGYRVALTVPTWAPALAVGFGNDTSWRASRARKQCNDTATQTAQQTLGATAQFRCLYKTARLTYSVTMITNPQPTQPPPKPKK
jgi:hypothetical protein